MIQLIIKEFNEEIGIEEHKEVNNKKWIQIKINKIANQKTNKRIVIKQKVDKVAQGVKDAKGEKRFNKSKKKDK